MADGAELFTGSYHEMFTNKSRMSPVADEDPDLDDIELAKQLLSRKTGMIRVLGTPVSVALITKQVFGNDDAKEALRNLLSSAKTCTYTFIGWFMTMLTDGSHIALMMIYNNGKVHNKVYACMHM